MANLDDKFNNRTVAKVAPTRDDVLAALKFGTPREVETKVGPRITREARLTPEFMALWEADQAALYAAGYTLTQWPAVSGPWRVTKWEKVPQKVIIQRQQARELSRATDATIIIPNPAAWQQLYEAGHAPPSGKISEGIALLRAENAELRAKASALCEQPLGFATATGPHVLVEQEPPVPESFVQGMQELAAQKAFDDLRAENAELRKDRERMDWVEKPTEGGDK